MRIIKFRGQKGTNGVWVYGSLVYSNEIGTTMYFQTGNGLVKRMDWVYVNQGTVGQFTGLYDTNGKEIYEGDILRIGNIQGDVCEVKWNETVCAFCIRFIFEHNIGIRPLGAWQECEKSIEIIGNIHDNPELMGRG